MHAPTRWCACAYEGVRACTDILRRGSSELRFMHAPTRSWRPFPLDSDAPGLVESAIVGDRLVDLRSAAV